MLKHLGEALVPFEDDGFARTPEFPLPGEAVTVRCRVDFTHEQPRLTLRDQTGERTLDATATDGRFYAFSLGAFAQPQQVSYRLHTAEEGTQWFSFAVTEPETCTKAQGCYRDGDTLRVALADGLSLAFRGGETLSVELLQQPAAGVPERGGAISLPQGFTLETGDDFLWRLNRLSRPVCTCTAVTVRKNIDGRVLEASQRMSLACAHVFGAGERFEAVELMGRQVLTRVVEKFTHQDENSYLPMPFFHTEQGFGWYRASDIPAIMRFGSVTEITQETEGETLTRDVLFFGSPEQVLAQYLHATGTPVLPPEWSFGVWISANGWKSETEVDAELAALAKYNYPASVMVLEQWSDEQTFYRWHPTHWADPAAMVRRVREAGLHMVLWQIPVVKHHWDGEPCEALVADTAEALAKGYVVRSADGSPYRLTERWFHHSYLPDFTNPEAVAWWFGKRKPLLDMGVEGFKTDGGEFLFEKGARLHDGSTGLRAHNLYPAQYVGAYQDFFRQNGVAGVTFSRAGYVGAQTQPIHWAGDQKSEWSELQACLNAGISAGLSGVLFWSFDIGGFAGPIPSAELYLRSTVFGCFCPVMQWHAEPRGGQFDGGLGDAYNNDRSPWNLAEKLHDDRVLTVACDFARLRETLRPYLWAEAQHCAAAGRPMMAHLCLNWPDDPRVWTVNDEYMLGRELLVAPLVRKGEDTRDVYLPEGEWTDFFTGEAFVGPCEIRVTCPLERIPVYRKVERHAGRED